MGCRACPRLVEWRERVAEEKRAAFAHEDYWGRPLPGFGDPDARMLVVGLAPAAHGGNRTGRIFTGDRSGDWLFGSLYRTGWANQPHSLHIGDGLRLDGAYITAAVRCAPPANKPTTEERDNCHNYLVRELELLSRVQVIVALGSFAWNSSLRAARRCRRRQCRGPVLVSATSPRPISVVAVYSAPITRVNRTHSPASSPRPCLTTCFGEPESADSQQRGRLGPVCRGLIHDT